MVAEVTVAPKAQYNFTDPESRIMKTSQDGFQQCWNAQVVLDAESQLIVATDLDNGASDQGRLPGLLAQVRAQYDHTPNRLLADAGYRKEEDLFDLEERGIDAYVALGREHREQAGSQAQGKATQRMFSKLATARGRALYAQRKGLVEPAFGWIKSIMGIRQLGPRGLVRARGEWNLICLAVNVRRLHRLRPA